MDKTIVTNLRYALRDMVDGSSPHDTQEYSGLPLSRCEEIHELAYSMSGDIAACRQALLDLIDGQGVHDTYRHTGMSLARCEKIHALAYGNVR